MQIKLFLSHDNVNVVGNILYRVPSDVLDFFMLIGIIIAEEEMKKKRQQMKFYYCFY